MTHVFEGTVRIEKIGAEYDRSDKNILHAGATGVVRPDKTVTVHGGGDESKAFTRVMPSLKDEWEAKAKRYAELVTSLNPVAYYRMEIPTDQKDRLVVYDSTNGGRHGTISGKCPDVELSQLWATRGRFGGALHLRGDYFGDYVVVPRPPDSESNQLSFFAWVLSDMRGSWCVLVNEGGSRYNCRFKIAQRKDDADVCAWVALTNPKPDEMIEVREGEDSPLPYGSWQHIALVADGKTIRLYSNGVEVSSSQCDGVIANPPGKYLVLGTTNWSEDPAGLEVHSHWSGWIDEVAVFLRALSPEEVKRFCDATGGQPLQSNNHNVQQ